MTRALALALWAWLLASVLVAALAWRFGGAGAAIAGATALAIAPALLGFALLPRLGESWARRALLAGWLIAAIGLAAGAGGAGSPVIALLLAAPALGYALNTRFPATLGAAAILGLAAADALAMVAPALRLGLWPVLTGAAALSLAVGLIAARRAQPRTPAALRVAEASHELRTPLTHILGFAEMIQAQIFGPLDPRYVEYAGLIRTSGSNLLEIVNSMLDLSRIEAGRYEVDLEMFDARDIAREVMQLSEGAAAPKSITLTEDYPSGPARVRADPRALRQMLINTVGNGVKFTPDGGRVTLRVRGEGGRVRFDTIDTGPGIPAAERARLGHPYERGAGAAGVMGTGLGLALVKGLAHLQGGVLSLHDAPSGGALVRFELPAA